MKITIDMIIKKKACLEGIGLFAKLYPNGVEVNLENLKKLRKKSETLNGLDTVSIQPLFWFIDSFGTRKARDAFYDETSDKDTDLKKFLEIMKW